MRHRFHSGLSFPDYLETVERYRDLWEGVYRRATVSDEVLEELAALPGRWHLLALSEDWCGDAANILPVVARLAESADNVELRIVSRDENPDLMDAHLTDGRSRSIPAIIILDEDYRERGWWGPRPEALQRWMMTEGLQMDPRPRYKASRTFYARDKGRSSLAGLLAVLKKAAIPEGLG